MNKRGALSIIQIFILVFGIIAISYAIGSEIEEVSGKTYVFKRPGDKDITITADTRADALLEFRRSGPLANWEVSEVSSPGTNTAGADKKAPKDPPSPSTNIPTKSSFDSVNLDGTDFKGFSSKGEGVVEGILKDGGKRNLDSGELKILEEKGWYKDGKLIDPKTDTVVGDWLAGKGVGSGTSNFVGHVTSGIGWAITVYGAVAMIGGLISDDEEGVNAAAVASATGVLAGKTAFGLIKEGGWLEGKLGTWVGNNAGLTSVGVGAAIAIAIFLATYKKTETKIVEASCMPWDASTGGSNCEKCNKQGALPCSEYQCRSLGQSCELLNPGTDSERCFWVNKNDVKPPVINPNNDALLDGYTYNPDNAISPPNRGVIIFNTDLKTGCVPAFTPFTFGVDLDEPAKCKLDYLRKETFEEMEFFFGGSSLDSSNHTQILRHLPGPSAAGNQSPVLQNDGEYELYTRCQDANGNTNTANFVFKFCVEKGPDTTPPMIIGTSWFPPEGGPIAYEEKSVDLEVYVNEPSECKWSHQDKTFDDMEETMTCSSNVFEMNAQMLYTCKTTLTGLKDNTENKFYFRCKDKPLETQDRNVNSESYEFSLIGTQPLVIDSVGPNGTVKDSTESVKVTLEAETSAGYKEGEAICEFGEESTGEVYDKFTPFLTHEHSYDTWLEEGDYEYFIKCMDLGGNFDTKTINFRVESDTAAPLVVRAYNDGDDLKLTTNEEAECVYDTTDCSYLFDDGTKMSSSDRYEHFTDWNTKLNLYIKCRDTYGNSPQPSNRCSMTVRAYEV